MEAVAVRPRALLDSLPLRLVADDRFPAMPSADTAFAAGVTLPARSVFDSTVSTDLVSRFSPSSRVMALSI